MVKEKDKNYIINYEYDDYGRLIEERNIENWVGNKWRYTKCYKYDYRDLLVESITKDGYTCQRKEFIYDNYGNVIEEYGYIIPYLQNQETGDYHCVKEYDMYGNCVSEIHKSFDDNKLFSKHLYEFEYYDIDIHTDNLPKKMVVAKNSEEGLLRRLASKNCSWFKVSDTPVNLPVKNAFDDYLLKIVTDGYPTKPFEFLTEKEIIEFGNLFEETILKIKDGVYKLVHVICDYTMYNPCTGNYYNTPCVPIVDDKIFFLIPLTSFVSKKYPFVIKDNRTSSNDKYSRYPIDYAVPFVEGEKKSDKVKRIIKKLSSVRTIQILHSPQIGHWDNPYDLRKRDFILTWAKVVDDNVNDFWLSSEISSLEYRLNEVFEKENDKG